MASEQKKKKIVTTPLGDGVLIHEFRDGTFCVEFPWGGGGVFLPNEVLWIKDHAKKSGVGRQVPGFHVSGELLSVLS